MPHERSGQGSMHPHLKPHSSATVHEAPTLSAAGPAFWCAAAGYLLVALQQPRGWGLAVWALLAFVLVPGFAGLVGGLKVGRVGTRQAHFRQAYWAVAWAMAGYTGLNLLILRARFTGSGFAGALLVWILVTAVYATAAGVVAGFGASLITGRSRQESTHELAS